MTIIIAINMAIIAIIIAILAIIAIIGYYDCHY